MKKLRARAWPTALVVTTLFMFGNQPGNASSGPNTGSAAASFQLSLDQAEREAMKTSNELKSYIASADAAHEQAGAQFSYLLPKLTFDGTYRYVTNVPTISLPIPGVAALPFGTHQNYSIGPTLTYTLWDTGATTDAYHALDRVAGARAEDRKAAELQLLVEVRAAYVRVQLALEEMRLVNDSLKLAEAQNHDITTNYHAGAASRLDSVDSQREVLNYLLQFQQRQADLSAALKDLLALTDEHPADVSHPGPPDVRNVTLVLNLDHLSKSLAEYGKWTFSPPDDHQPQIHSQELLAQSSELQASSQKDALYPVLQVQARASIDYPNGIVPEHVEQNTFTVALSMPLFETDHTRHLAAEHYKEAESARFRKEQLQIDLQRDYQKAREMLDNLREQQNIASQDVLSSEESARLYYSSYKAGKINFTDVLSANLRALTAKVDAARIDAQILNQIIILKSISGGDSNHG
jgi:outer membrane protein TolC